MDTSPYGKHQLYRGNYKMSKGGEIKLPDKCYWRVGKYQGDHTWGYEADDIGAITLLLEEDYGDGNGFWSVISFLSPDEAKELAQQLLDMATNTKRVEIVW